MQFRAEIIGGIVIVVLTLFFKMPVNITLWTIAAGVAYLFAVYVLY